MPKALEIFHKAAKNVAAYKKILKQAGVNAANIKTMRDFERVPIIDKNSYIKPHKLTELMSGGKFPPMIYASSGSSGKPTFWFRADAQEEHAAFMSAFSVNCSI